MLHDDPWQLEEEEEETPQQEYHPKAYLVLEGSDKFDWGLVKDCIGHVNFIPEDAEVVGTWNTYGDGVFWVSLTTSINALSDKAIQLTKEIADKRPTSVPKAKREPKQTRTVKEVAEEQPSLDIDRLRKLIGR